MSTTEARAIAEATRAQLVTKQPPFWWRLHEPSATMLARMIIAIGLLGVSATAWFLGKQDMATTFLAPGLTFAGYFFGEQKGR